MTNDSMNEIYVRLYQEEMQRVAQQRRLIAQAQPPQERTVPFYTRLTRRLLSWFGRVGSGKRGELKSSPKGKPLIQAITPVPVTRGPAGNTSFSDKRKPQGKGAG